MSAVLDVVSAVLMVAGALLSFAAGIGLVRFGDVLARMHAGSKPQALGILLMLLAAALQTGPRTAAVLVLVAFFQLLTVPVGTHLMARSAYRSGLAPTGQLASDDLAGTWSGPDAGSGAVGSGAVGSVALGQQDPQHDVDQHLRPGQDDRGDEEHPDQGGADAEAAGDAGADPGDDAVRP